MDNTRDSSNIIFNTRNEAEDVLDHMNEIAKTYGNATFADFCDLAGVASVYADTRYYWTIDMLKDAKVLRVRYGHVVDLMRPMWNPPGNSSQSKTSAKVSCVSHRNNTRQSKPEPKTLTITVNTEEVDDIGDIMAEVFKYVYTITDRDVQIYIT